MELFKNIYKNKRVLVTGHTGFKGSWLSLWLHDLGAEVAGFSKYLPTEPCHYDVLKLGSKLKNYEGDIRNADELKKTFDEFKPQIVFHLAAQPIVRFSYDEAKLTFDTNLGGTVNVLECIKDSSSIRAGVMITSDKCYENDGRAVGYHEDDRLGGADPYSASKACAEIAFSSYFRSFFNKEGGARLAAARAGNVVGGGDWAQDRIVPDCARAWSEGKELIIRSPDATRPWQHVLEPLSGYLWLGAQIYDNEQQCVGESFNFGPHPSDVKSVGDLVELLSKYWGQGSWEYLTDEGNKKEAALLQLSCDKAKELLEWESILTFNETVKYTAEWFKHFYGQADQIFELSLSQIRDYTNKGSLKKASWLK